MKILHLINTLSTGGAEMHLLTLCRHLKRQDVQIVVACLREQVKGSRSLRSDFERENIRVVNLHANSRYDSLLLKVARLLRMERPDILHTHLPRADLCGVFAHIFHPSVVWVCSVHDIHDNSWSGRWALPLFNFVWRRADRIVAISRAVADWLVHEHSVPQKKISVIHYGIEADRFSQCGDNLRERWDLKDKLIVGAIGRLEPRKGHDCLVRSMSELEKVVPNACLLIAGHDPFGYGNQLQTLIDQLNLRPRVRLVGFQNDIAAFLGALDVFAFATHSEGFGQVVIEAMAAGKTLVVSNVPPLTEIVLDGETGMLVQPENPKAFAQAISWLLLHRKEADEMGKRAKQRVYEHFSAKRMANETMCLYESLLGPMPYELAEAPGQQN